MNRRTFLEMVAGAFAAARGVQTIRSAHAEDRKPEDSREKRQHKIKMISPDEEVFRIWRERLPWQYDENEIPLGLYARGVQ